MRHPFLLLSFSIFAAALFVSQSSNDVNSNNLAQEIESLIAQTMKDNDIPALSASIIYKGDVVLSRGYGVRKRNFQEGVNEHTTYQIASLSKTFTGIIANHLVQEGKLNLESSILDYLPNTLSKKTMKKLKPIKVVDLLHHRSGMPSDSKVVKREDGEPMISGYSEEALLLDLEKINLKSKPGTKYRYSNLGYAVVGYLLERASGLSYAALLKKYVSDKYQLKSTSTLLSLYDETQMATPYRKEFRGMETKPWQTGKLVAASGIFSNTYDLSKLMLLQLNAYHESPLSNNPLILTQSKYQINDEDRSYGLGLFETATNRGVLYGHRGDMDGFASEYSFNPSKNTGVVLLTSSGGEWLGLLAAKINKMLEES